MDGSKMASGETFPFRVFSPIFYILALSSLQLSLCKDYHILDVPCTLNPLNTNIAHPMLRLHIYLQEAMASFAFPIKSRNKSNELMDVFLTFATITQNHSKLFVFSLETSGKYPFPFLFATQREMYWSKKSQRKNLFKAMHKKYTPSGHAGVTNT